ncbi:MAG TPA: SulP family inorganic anion transporter [Chitinophagaceae bacterium]|nr:SulP family inorganic anion transporter [Chitinophagaceae bacterium]
MAPRAKDYIKSLPNDFAASIVVFLVALPLCLGIALASNAPLFSGLIAGIIGGIVIGLASRSHLSVSGPAAGLSAIVAGAIALLPSFEAFLLAVVIAGIFQIALGFAKSGIIGDYVPNSVIKGMLAAIGLILILNQVPHLLGDDSHFESDEGVPQAKGNIFSNFIFAFGNVNTTALLIGGVCLVFYFLWEKLVSGKKGLIRFVPAPLIVVILAVIINYFFQQKGTGLNGEHLVVIPQASSANEFFSFFSSPDWGMIMNKNVWIIAITLALVASLESLLSIEAIDDLDPYQRVTPTNRELKAQGLGNLFSGLLGGLPVTSVIVRSSANVNAGAKTKMSTIYHGILLLVSVAFVPAILNMIPKTALAAILIFTGYKLAKPALFIAFYKKGWDQFLPFVITIVAILSTDLLKGVIIGIGVGLFFVIRSNFRSSVVVVNDNNRYLIRLRKDVSFLNKPIIKKKLEEVPENSHVLIDAGRADFIDKDIIEVIEDFIIHAPLSNITVEVKRSLYKDQGFNRKLVPPDANGRYVRTHEKTIKPATEI